jgi:hypothetical protein
LAGIEGTGQKLETSPQAGLDIPAEWRCAEFGSDPPKSAQEHRLAQRKRGRVVADEARQQRRTNVSYMKYVRAVLLQPRSLDRHCHLAPRDHVTARLRSQDAGVEETRCGVVHTAQTDEGDSVIDQVELVRV